MRYIAPFLGTGKDGPKISSSNEDINPVRQSCTVTLNTNTINVTNHNSYNDGDLVFIHKTKGTANTGAYRFARVISRSGNVLTVDRNINLAFSDSGVEQSQCIKVPEYSRWAINNGVTIAPATWDGNVGGIIVAVIQGDLIINSGGIISATGRGYAGGAGGSSGGNLGVQGESYAGTPSASTSANNTGGGGGNRNPTNGVWSAGAAGGGGGNYTAGNNGSWQGGANTGACGVGGALFNNSTLQVLLFGGGGGGGSADDTASGGAGGRGGGIIYVLARRIIINGSILNRGNQGGAGGDPGGGANGGTGGSGAGGSTFLGSIYGIFGTNLITTTGGDSVLANTYSRGGAGGLGNTRIEVGQSSGSISNGTIIKGGLDWIGSIGVL